MINFLKEKKNLIYLGLIILIMVGSVFMYFYSLKTIPGGVFPDAAANGLDSNLILDGEHAPFFERGNGRESLFFYLMAGSITLFGVNNWSILIPGVICALFLILGVYLLAKEWFNPSVGIMAALMTSLSYWLLIISRSGFRAILVPLFLVFFIYFLTLAIKRTSQTALFASLSGLFWGLGFYSYISYRMALAWIVVFVIMLLIAKYSDRQKYATYAKAAVWFSLFAIISLLPLLIYFIQDPAAIVGRAGQVSIFNPEYNQGDLIGTFFQELKKNILAFWQAGDLNWRHNISGWSLIDPITSLFLIGGLIFFLIRSLGFIRNLFSKLSFNSFEYFMIFGSFLLMLVPAVMSAEGSPHGLRLIGCLPWVMIMAAWFLVTVFNYLWQLKGQAMKIAASLVLVVAVVGMFVINLTGFWTETAHSADYYYAVRQDLTPVSKYIIERNDKENTFLALDDFSQQTTEFLTSNLNQPYTPVGLDMITWLDLGPGQVVIFTASTMDLTEQFESTHTNSEIVKQEYSEQSTRELELIRVYANK